MTSICRLFLSALLVLSSPFALSAQDGPPKPSPEQEALARSVGEWDCTASFFDGGKKLGSLRLREQTERVCGGLFVLVRQTGVDMPLERVSLQGWDATKSRLVGVDADSVSATPTNSVGTVDLKTGAIAWTMTTTTEQGTGVMESTITFEGDDVRIERQHAKGPDGERILVNETRSVRVKVSGEQGSNEASSLRKADEIKRALEAGAKLAANSKPHARLAAFAGDWDVTATMGAADGTPQGTGSMKSRESIVCGGRWLLTRVDGTFAEMPFHAIGLMGFDPVSKRYVNHWADSFGAYLAKSQGTANDDGTKFEMSGPSLGMDGSETTMDESLTFEGADARTSRMLTKNKDGVVIGTMTIRCVRAK